MKIKQQKMDPKNNSKSEKKGFEEGEIVNN